MTREQEVQAIKKLGDEMGYGHLMSLASAIWRKKLLDVNVPVSGAFVPTIDSFIKDEHKDTLIENKFYDEIVKVNGW